MYEQKLPNQTLSLAYSITKNLLKLSLTEQSKGGNGGSEDTLNVVAADVLYALYLRANIAQFLVASG